MRFATSDGASLAIFESGPPTGQSVVLVHGLAGSTEISWRSNRVIDALEAAGLRVVSFDLRGHGQSDRGPDLDMRQERLVGDVREVTKTYGDNRALVVGYSLGGSLALLACADGLQAARLVVGGLPTAVLAWTPADAAQCQSLALALRKSSDADPSMRGVVQFFELIDASLPCLAALMDDHHPTVSNWNAVTMPVTVVVGLDDTNAADPAQVVAQLPHAQAKHVPGDHITTPGGEAFVDLVVAEAAACG
jgi:pimeloyl-ACP methyl ester carboxylesterase